MCASVQISTQVGVTASVPDDFVDNFSFVKLPVHVCVKFFLEFIVALTAADDRAVIAQS